MLDREPSGIAVSELDEGEESLIMNKVLYNEDDAYEVYNQYAYFKGFSIRKSNQKFRSDKKRLYSKEFCCWRVGLKSEKGVADKAYSKIDYQTDCQAKVQFHIDDDGVWTLVRHEMVHNHELVAAHQRHMLKSHRRLARTNLEFIQNLKKSGVRVSTAVRSIKNRLGGSPVMGFTLKDAYNTLAKEQSKKIEGSDSNGLINIFKKRFIEEENFYYDFELDEEGRLCNFFFRDGLMRSDYEKFGDLVVHDITYRTNKYDLICGPFVGMNHHNCNVMFGLGFILNETTESFIWLFTTFLKSMDGSQPVTIMTDQSTAMAAAISIIFTQSHHRLCVWHIEVNSKKNIKGLRKKKDFVDYFNHVLKYVETKAEFNFYWEKMMITYNCWDNSWLKNLYKIRHKWCPAFSKDFFSGGILSSQRSEATNKSVSDGLRKTASLCDFYGFFVEVVKDWRSKENGKDFQCLNGQRQMAISGISLLIHARKVYTIEIYVLFEEQYIKGLACHHAKQGMADGNVVYVVWRPKVDMIRHLVSYNETDHTVSCTCKLFLEVGILCRHYLRVYDINCVERIPTQYIIKRWNKEAIKTFVAQNHSSSSNTEVESVFLWRTSLLRNFNELFLSCGSDVTLQRVCDEAYQWARDSINEHRRSSETQDQDVNMGCETVGDDVHVGEMILNPSGSRKKGERNIRKKSTFEKKSNAFKGRNRHGKYAAARTKAAVQSSVLETVKEITRDGYFLHPMDGGESLNIVGGNNEQLVIGNQVAEVGGSLDMLKCAPNYGNQIDEAAFFSFV